MDLLLGDTASPSGEGAAIADSSTRTFMQDAIEASMTTPVVVVFWTPRSPACKETLALAGRLAAAARGKVKAVKIDIDREPELARQMQVRAVPTLFAIKEGRPLDMLPGPQPESEVRAFFDRLEGKTGPDPRIEPMLAAARDALDKGDLKQAIGLYQQVLQLSPGDPAAIGGFLRCNLSAGHVAEAQKILDQLPPDIKKHPEIQAVATTLELAAEAAGVDAAAAERRLAADPGDHQARFDLALAAYARGDAGRAIALLLEIVARDRTWKDDAARLRLLKILEALGPADPAAKAGRRRLQMLLMV